MRDALTDDEKRLLIHMLNLEIEQDRFPLSPRVESMKRIRAKLMAQDVLAEPSPAKHKS